MVLPGEGRVLSILGATLALHAVGEDTGGALAIMEWVIPPRFSGQPLHYHAHTLEALYVLGGTLTLQLQGQMLDAPPGSFILVSPTQLHTFINRTNAPARFLIYSAPAGLEHHFEELAGLAAREPSWPPADEKLGAIVAKYDFHLPET